MGRGGENTSAVLEMDISYFARILQVLGRSWRINKLQPDEEKCSDLLSHFPQAFECNFTLIMFFYTYIGFPLYAMEWLADMQVSDQHSHVRDAADLPTLVHLEL